MAKIVEVVLVVVVLIVIWYICVSNSIKVAALKIEESEAGIDVALTKRYDVLTKMLDTVKGYQQYEKTVLAELVKLRSGMSIAEKMKRIKTWIRSQRISGCLWRIIRSFGRMLLLGSCRRQSWMWRSICRLPDGYIMQM